MNETRELGDVMADVSASFDGGGVATEQPDGDLVARLGVWVELTNQKRDLEAKLREVQDKLTAMEEPLLEDLALSGMESAKVRGMTVYKQREFFCRSKPGVDKEQLFESFRRAGLIDALGLQWQTMRAFAKEWSEAGVPVPTEISGLVEIGDHFRLRARKS